MKRILLIAFVACLASACKKTGISPGLFGKWELRSEVGSIVGFDSTFTAGNGRVFIFNRDSTYKRLNKGVLVSQGTFHIKAFYPPSGYASESIFFNDNTSGVPFIFNGTQLTIGADIDDGVATTYQKIGN